MGFAISPMGSSNFGLAVILLAERAKPSFVARNYVNLTRFLALVSLLIPQPDSAELEALHVAALAPLGNQCVKGVGARRVSLADHA